MRKRTDSLTTEMLRSILNFDPDSGNFTWAIPVNKIPAGSAAGTLNKQGYVAIVVCGEKYKAHRLAWLHHYGVWPASSVDHINGFKTDNRIVNLRDVSHQCNQQNRTAPSKNNTVGFLGVRPKRNGFRAQITVGGKSKYLGTFETPELASAAYLVAKRQLHEGCTI